MKIIKAEWTTDLLSHDGRYRYRFILLVEEDDGARKTYYNSAAARLLNGKTLS